MRYCVGIIGAAALFVTATALFAQDFPVMSDGKGVWTRIASATVKDPLHPLPTRLRVVTRGRIVLRGGNVSQVTFHVKQQVRARSEVEARVMLGPLGPAQMD